MSKGGYMRLRKILSVFLSFVIGLPLVMTVCAGAPMNGNEIYVSPDGNDSADGSIGSPLATLSAAKEAAKAMNGSVTVYLRGGNYTINEALNFTSADKSGITFRSFDGETAVLTSGTPYTGFEECSVNGVKAFRKNIGKGADFNVLFSEKEKLRRPVYPEKGYLYVRSVSEKDIINPEMTENFHKSFTAMTVNPSDIGSFRNMKDICIRILHYWKDEMLTIKSYNPSTGRMEFSRPTSMGVSENDRYFLQNVFEALNEPGEWYLDKAEGTLYYIPYAGEQPDKITLWGSVTETMINIDGANGISFQNIVFRGNGFNIPKNNTGRDDSSQAAYDATPCVSCENASDFTIKNCEFRDIAACAVFLGENVKNAVIDSTYFENLGAQAVYIRGENVPVDDPAVTKNITVSNNIISGYGKEFYNAVGVLIIHANSVTVTDNEIHDGYYTAISVGWSWGYGYSVTYNCKITNNLIYNIGQGWLSDMGGIYTLGIQRGTVLSGNVIHNVAADPGQGGYGGWGIYLDEGSSYITVEKNLTYACGNDGYHLHYGSYNKVRNNIFALNGESQIRVLSNFSRVTPEDGGKETAEFTKNIILTDNKVRAFSHLTDKSAYSESENVFWDLSNGGELYFSTGGDASDSMSLETAVRRGYISSPVVADPGFKNAAEFDFELSEDSPVFEAGFEKWDYSEAGTDKGTTVGISLQGGQTAYNAASSQAEPTPSRERFHFIMIIINALSEFFSRIFGRR